MSSWVLVGFVNCWATMGTPRLLFELDYLEPNFKVGKKRLIFNHFAMLNLKKFKLNTSMGVYWLRKCYSLTSLILWIFQFVLQVFSSASLYEPLKRLTSKNMWRQSPVPENSSWFVSLTSILFRTCYLDRPNSYFYLFYLLCVLNSSLYFLSYTLLLLLF